MSLGAAIPAKPSAAEVQARLGSWSVFAGVLAAAGIPIYIHAPKVYVDSYGVSLASLGLVLFALRLLDVVQDPALGWLSERLRARRQASVAVALGLMAAAMVGLFAVTPPVAPLLWFAITLTLLFSAFSFLTITYYAEGVAKAGTLGSEGHLRLAAWRESGALGGICIAAAMPSILVGMDLPIGWYAVAFVLACAVASVVMRGEWGRRAAMPAEPGFRRVLADPVSRRLLLLALINAMPVAVTSTLFLYFVESRLVAPGWEGPLLLLFFLSAAAWAPLWSQLAQKIGAKRSLLIGMTLSIVTFAFAAFLGEGDRVFFAVICIASGAALGADLTLLPAIFARRIETIAPGAGEAFGLWSFVSKFTLAFAAVTLLPALDRAGFVPGGENTPDVLFTLTVLYALVPCALKLIAIALLAATPLKEG